LALAHAAPRCATRIEGARVHSFHPDVVFGLDPIWTSTILLVAVYAVIVTEWVNRAIVALLGAGLMIQFGVLDQAEAVKGIDFDTIALLAGTMIVVAIAAKSGVFQYLAVLSAQKARAEPWRVMLLLSITTAALSAFLNNVTVVLLVAPVTLVITKELDVPPFPFLFAEVFASNIGGTATLIGDPPNMLIGNEAHLTFNQFVLHLTPVVIVVMAAQALVTHLLWGRRMRASAAAEARVMAMKAVQSIEDRTLALQSAIILGAMTVAFVFAQPLHLENGTIAMFGAAILMLLDAHGHHAHVQSQKVTETFNEIEWVTIFFFIGLFIVVHGVEVSGLLAHVADLLARATGGNVEAGAYALLWVSAVLSALLDNIPFVATMIPVIKTAAPAYGGAGQIEPLWWALSLGACLGGNATLIGASANLAMAGLAERNGIRFGVWQYARYAVPMTLLSLAICHLYLWLRYF
jgi:Na+/H+ antiporter NhaD/arsenite permease-like protein